MCETFCFLPIGVLSAFALLLFTGKLVILNKVYFKLARVSCGGVLLSQYTFIKHMLFVCRLSCSSANLEKTTPKPHIYSEIPFLKPDSKASFFPLPASQKTISSCICVLQKWCRLLACAHKIYVLSRPSPGWGDCGGSCTLFGSMSAVYTLGSSC